ncbi:MAG: DUF6600 domain-containing protein, partial [Thermodesulfobacteriota bacterium]
MKRRATARWWLGVALLLAGLAGCESLPAGSGGYQGPTWYGPGAFVGLDVFHDALAPYGTWVDHWSYGRAWYPRGVGRSWRPYSRGHWEHTLDYGWVWVADEPWGWAPFHYGRWAWDSWYGWMWVPGQTWGPGWVWWRRGGGYVAWAPLPPDVLYLPGSGYRVDSFDCDRDLSWDSWVAVPETALASPDLPSQVLPAEGNPPVLAVTTSVTDPVASAEQPKNDAVPVAEVEDKAGRPVPRRRLRPVASPTAQPGATPDELVVVQPPLPQLGPGDEARLRDLAERVVRAREADRQAGGEPDGRALRPEERRPRVARRFLAAPEEAADQVVAPGAPPAPDAGQPAAPPPAPALP